MRRCALYTAAVAAALSLAPAGASAQKAAPGTGAAKAPSGDVARARALFDKGISLSDEGKWTDALDAFKESDTLVPSAKVRFNMGASLRALGRYVEAKRLLSKLFAEEDGFKLKPDLRANAQKMLDEVDAKVVVAHVTVLPAAAKLEIDGDAGQLDATGATELDPGKHVFVVSAEGYDTTTVTRTLASGKSDVAITAPPKKVIEKRVEVPAPPPTPVYKRAWFWVGLSTLAAGGAAVGVFFVVRPDKKAPVPPTSTTDVVIATSFQF